MHHLVGADTYNELHDCLSSINVVVPPRSQGRTKEHTETYCIVRLLGSLPNDTLAFPIRLLKRERPDFELHIAKTIVGIEHTEAISENAAHEAFLRSKGHGPEVHFVHRSIVGEPKKSRAQLISDIEQDKPEPWMGDSIEQEWAAAMAHSVSNKMTTARQYGFTLYEHNWLLVYNNWSPSPELEDRKTISFLKTELSIANPWGTFSRIFILGERLLLEASHDYLKVHKVNHCSP